MLASPLFGPEQPPFIGLDLGIRPALFLVPDPYDEVDGVAGVADEAVPGGGMPGQLCLSWTQLLLSEVEPEPRQPSLLPEPPPWEELVVPRHVRATRGRSRSDAEQLRLFS